MWPRTNLNAKVNQNYAVTLNRKSQGQGHRERLQLRRFHQGLFPCEVSSLYWLMWPRTNLNAEVNQNVDGQTDRHHQSISRNCFAIRPKTLEKYIKINDLLTITFALFVLNYIRTTMFASALQTQVVGRWPLYRRSKFIGPFQQFSFKQNIFHLKAFSKTFKQRIVITS